MERTNKEYLELIDETVKFYTEDVSRRAVVSKRCVYNGINNEGEPVHCAVGRCLVDEIINNSAIEGTSVKGLLHRLNYNNSKELVMFNDLFKDEYKGFDLAFWRELQQLHDNELNWDDNGLSLIGHGKAERIKDLYQE